MRLNLDDLQGVISLLLSNIKDEKGVEIELKNDFYWDISAKELYNPYEEPKDITLGQLSDDIQEVKKLSQSGENAIPYDLKRVAEILKAISIENVTVF